MANHFEIEMDRPRELLGPTLLVLLAESPGHGYELMERLRPVGFDWGGPGPIYRELRSLEDAGHITSNWFLGQRGPGRPVYEITPSGRESLDRSVAGVLGLHRRVPGPPPSGSPAEAASRRRTPAAPSLTSGQGRFVMTPLGSNKCRRTLAGGDAIRRPCSH